VKTDARLGKHIIEFERFGEIGIEDHRPVADAEVDAHIFDDFGELAQTLLQQRAIAEDGAVPLHGPLHRQSDGPRLSTTL
jgi:hypothetical protein